MQCPTCGIELPEGASGTCSSKLTLICIGEYEAGCGAVLTNEERHWYGTICEKCVRAWDARIDAWRAGADDPHLDRLFGGGPDHRH